MRLNLAYCKWRFSIGFTMFKTSFVSDWRDVELLTPRILTRVANRKLDLTG